MPYVPLDRHASLAMTAALGRPGWQLPRGIIYANTLLLYACHRPLAAGAPPAMLRSAALEIELRDDAGIPDNARPRSRLCARSGTRPACLNSRLAPRAPCLPAAAPASRMGGYAGLTEFPDALKDMEARAEAIARGEKPERVWLIEHPPFYTAGTSAKDSDLIDARFPVYRAGRGGQFTYHGPGQRVAYVMLDLKRRRPDVRAYVAALEGWLIDALKAFDIVGETREDRVGVWVAPG